MSDEAICYWATFILWTGLAGTRDFGIWWLVGCSASWVVLVGFVFIRYRIRQSRKEEGDADQG